MQVRDNTTRTFFAELYVTKLEICRQARSYKDITLTSSLALKWQDLEDVLCCLVKLLVKNENSEFVLI